jgi:undecaprenyl diphosphate synthase
MDGNGRWANKRGLPRLEGHQAGVKRISSIVKTAITRDIKHLTVFGFSTENWRRPEEEVKGLFDMLEQNIDREAAKLHKHNVKIVHLGRIDGLPDGVQTSIKRACKLTEKNNRLFLNFAFNYGGRTEIVDAARTLLREKINHEELTAQMFSSRLYCPELPDVDLLIRTGGEKRISNFLLWQSAYAELYFTPTLWPDFTPSKLIKALENYSCRQRRFGGIVDTA